MLAPARTGVFVGYGVRATKHTPDPMEAVEGKIWRILEDKNSAAGVGGQPRCLRTVAQVRARTQA